MPTLERTTVREYGDVIIIAGMVDSSGSQVFGLFADERDARSPDADSLVIATVGREALTDAQIATAQRNADSL